MLLCVLELGAVVLLDLEQYVALLVTHSSITLQLFLSAS